MWTLTNAPCYIAIVTGYSVKKDGLKKNSQREVTEKLR